MLCKFELNIRFDSRLPLVLCFFLLLQKSEKICRKCAQTTLHIRTTSSCYRNTDMTDIFEYARSSARKKQRIRSWSTDELCSLFSGPFLACFWILYKQMQSKNAFLDIQWCIYAPNISCNVKGMGCGSSKSPSASGQNIRDEPSQNKKDNNSIFPEKRVSEEQAVGASRETTEACQKADDVQKESCVVESKTAAKSRELTILHFNDVYNIEARDKEPVGGAARFATKVASFTHLNPLIVFSGDCLNPSTSEYTSQFIK